MFSGTSVFELTVRVSAFIHVFAFGSHDLQSSNSWKLILGCLVKPRGGSSELPVTNCNTVFKVIPGLLPAVKVEKKKQL